MPDRDIFTALSPPLRRMARSFVHAARGRDLDRLTAAEGINHLFDGGVASLPMILKCLAPQGTDARQARFEDDSFAYIHRAALNRVHLKDWRDQILCQEAIRAHGLGIHDEQYVLRCFVMSAINSRVVEARGGVVDQFSKQGTKFDVQELEQQLSPLIDTAVGMMLRNPHFKRLGLASKFRREVDLYENLL